MYAVTHLLSRLVRCLSRVYSRTLLACDENLGCEMEEHASIPLRLLFDKFIVSISLAHVNDSSGVLCVLSLVVELLVEP